MIGLVTTNQSEKQKSRLENHIQSQLDVRINYETGIPKSTIDLQTMYRKDFRNCAVDKTQSCKKKEK